MRIVKPAVVVEDDIAQLGVDFLKKIEKFTRKCYKSEDKITDDSYRDFVKRVYQTRKHEGIIEHRSVSVTFVSDRGVSHEAVRHRMASYLQESTRYCDYSASGKFHGVTFIMPPWLEVGSDDYWMFVSNLKIAEERYQQARDRGWKPEQARGFLPHFVKTEWTQTMNLGSWNNFFAKRCAPNAHPQIRQLAIPLLREFQKHIPIVFDHHVVPALAHEEAKMISDSSALEVVAQY